MENTEAKRYTSLPPLYRVRTVKMNNCGILIKPYNPDSYHASPTCLPSPLLLSLTTVLIGCCRFRIFCHRVISHNYFSNIVLACILVSSTMLAAEDPLVAQSSRNRVSLSTASRRQCPAILVYLFTYLFLRCLSFPSVSYNFLVITISLCFLFATNIKMSHILLCLIFFAKTKNTV